MTQAVEFDLPLLKPLSLKGLGNFANRKVKYFSRAKHFFEYSPLGHMGEGALAWKEYFLSEESPSSPEGERYFFNQFHNRFDEIPGAYDYPAESIIKSKIYYLSPAQLERAIIKWLPLLKQRAWRLRLDGNASLSSEHAAIIKKYPDLSLDYIEEPAQVKDLSAFEGLPLAIDENMDLALDKPEIFQFYRFAVVKPALYKPEAFMALHRYLKELHISLVFSGLFESPLGMTHWLRLAMAMEPGVCHGYGFHNLYPPDVVRAYGEFLQVSGNCLKIKLFDYKDILHNLRNYAVQ